MVDRARAMAEGRLAPVVPRDAATVALLRDTGQGLEVHLQRRVRSMAFGPGMYVFPGGSVDPTDADAPVEMPGNWPQLFGGDLRLARTIVCAAVRETFEEAGVLLAGGPTDVDTYAGDREALAARTTSFAEVLARHGLTLRPDSLKPWARWVTPEFESHRFDTRFFVAALPAGQQVAGDDAGGEADHSVWLRPAEALARHRGGELELMPPTAFTLSELTEYADTAEVLSAAEERDCRVVLPRVVLDGDQLRFVLPSDEVPDEEDG
jgi:8-oxo-dGTP pyrophosphatase MutT (NUDIX family)